jgi:DNA-binding HxlR family transcriptional regulator
MMTRTHGDLSDLPASKDGENARQSPLEVAFEVEQALKPFEGRWKLEILFCLFGGRVRRFSDLEREIDGVSQKMLAQQLRQLEADGLVGRTVHPEVPPKVEYALTEWGQSLCPALDALLKWRSSAPTSHMI